MRAGDIDWKKKKTKSEELTLELNNYKLNYFLPFLMLYLCIHWTLYTKKDDDTYHMK